MDNWREIFSTLSRNKTRTLMTAFGIFWGTAILAICWGGGRGFQGMMRRNFQGFSTNMAYMSSDLTTKGYNGFNEGRWWYMTWKDIGEIRRTVDNIDLMSAIISVSTTAQAGTRSVGTTATGVEPDYFRIQQLKLLSGRFLTESDNAARRKYAVIGKNVANQLFGDEDPLGRMVALDGVWFRVVGVVSQLTDVTIGGGRVDEAVIVPLPSLSMIYNIGDNIGFIIFTTPSGVKPSDLKPRLTHILYRNHSIAPDDEGALDFGDLSEMFEMVDNVFLGVDLLMLFVGFGTLLAGVIGVGNIMWIIVKERTREFGIRRAIGATPRDMIVQILSESIVLTTLAGLAGITLSAIGLGIVDHAQYDPWLGYPGFELKFAHAVAILLLFLVLGTAAGIIPALRAMKIKPVEAMNDK
ncbi:MAG: ABC transporter permease [Clostridium sp.]|nr:ABC transporter permease [Clostridium sp.]